MYVLLIVPSALILLNPVKGSLTSIPWLFLAVLILGIGDSIFAYTYNVRAIEDLIWISKLFFITSYVIAAGGLFWHKFFIVFLKDRTVSFANIQRFSFQFMKIATSHKGMCHS